MALWPAYMTVAGLLGLAGIAKLRSPATAGVTLAAIGLRSAAALVRVLGAGELALAAACIAAPGRLPAAFLATAYLAFGGAVLRLRAARAGGGCGCFGDASARAGLWHFALNLAAAAVALIAVAAPPPGWGAVADRPGELVVAFAGVATAVALGKLAFTAFPVAWSAYRSDAHVGAAR